MSEATERHQLPLLQSGQSQKEVTHNEALVRLDALLHLAVESRTASVPLVSPTLGATWIVAVGAAGDWSGQMGGSLTTTRAVGPSSSRATAALPG